jgi:hypothetical protein
MSKKTGPLAASLKDLVVVNKQQPTPSIFSPQPQQLSADLKQLDITKSSHQIYRILVDDDGIGQIRLFMTDGRGGWKPTREHFRFHIKHGEKIGSGFIEAFRKWGAAR